MIQGFDYDNYELPDLDDNSEDNIKRIEDGLEREYKRIKMLEKQDNTTKPIS